MKDYSNKNWIKKQNSYIRNGLPVTVLFCGLFSLMLYIDLYLIGGLN